MKNNISYVKFILVTSFVFTCFYNLSFYKKILQVYPISNNILYVFSLGLFLFLASNIFITIIFTFFEIFARIFKIKKWYLVFFGLVFFLAMSAAYVMDSFGVVIDEVMLLNVIKTDFGEAYDLLTFKFFLYFTFLFLVPMLILKKLNFREKSFVSEIRERCASLILSFFLIFVIVLSSGKFYASFFREQKPIRYYSNPTYWIYSSGKFVFDLLSSEDNQFYAYGRDSIIPKDDNDRELIIFVLGETARRDRFSLNGHFNETNPLLKKENIFNFSNVTSCGTSTAISVPCMFSHFGRNNFKVNNARNTENLVDVLSHTKDVSVLWRDNNSDSKGVALRVKYEDYKTQDRNQICDTECRDEGMLVGLQEYVDQVKTKDIFIVLHQMGNHGPAYFKRYPKKFEIFKPVCKTNELDKCTNEEIGNAYDNAILYTDYFLAKVISFLKLNSNKFNTAMLYVSDHGESLGENGVYLHSLPYLMAPKEQIEVPMIMWFGGKMLEETSQIKLNRILGFPFSHDNIFHTVLGMMEVKSSAYDANKDILHGIHKQ